jgi:hypothetical protein
MVALESWLKLLEHVFRRPASRALCTAGKSRPIKVLMMAMTTSSSTRVKPRLVVRAFIQETLLSGSQLVDGLADNLTSKESMPLYRIISRHGRNVQLSFVAFVL